MLNDLAKNIHAQAQISGWYDEERPFPEMLMLCVSELSEALEEYRNGEPIKGIRMEAGNKPCGISTELADTIIRILDYCAYADIDIDTAVRFKMEYNKTRPYRHNNKVC